MRIKRILDANINRVSEGLRVIEDIMRFYYNNRITSKAIRELRHSVRKNMDLHVIKYRDVLKDVGLVTSQESLLDKKETIEQLLQANFKRAEEGLRVIEEVLKQEDYPLSKVYEGFRYRLYDLERRAYSKAYPNKNQLYLILGEAFSNGRTNKEVLKEALEAGIRIVQYREKKKSKKSKLNECLELIEMVHAYEGLFIVNDDLDLALLVEADGIHLGQDDLPIQQARKLAGQMLIGVSTHTMDQAIEAELAGADYIGVGPIFPTETKENVEKSAGIPFLKEVSETIKIPYVAIGGIKENNLSEIKMYTNQVAMITEIVRATDIQKKIKNIMKELD